ncbi:hypothetical protein [Ureibacillus manganicus]|uniref:Uncharacterized protein n=1 Tax=Ureibacillus manganicus DSM 26584 TaxID=1384049 RepID=A0A0A3I3W9_9BACL|nr:hypothetical protein [Ureibacillus manganicus]KGR79409.1 hypothetical protein CD29_06865 [Ureibacillus manganicus DSM 26584]
MKLYLITTQMVYYVAFVLWVIFWGMALSAILQVPTFENMLFFAITTLYPIAVIVCTIFAWNFHMNKRSISIVINIVPAIWLICYYIYFFH